MDARTNEGRGSVILRPTRAHLHNYTRKTAQRRALPLVRKLLQSHVSDADKSRRRRLPNPGFATTS